MNNGVPAIEEKKDLKKGKVYRLEFLNGNENKFNLCLHRMSSKNPGKKFIVKIKKTEIGKIFFDPNSSLQNAGSGNFKGTMKKFLVLYDEEITEDNALSAIASLTWEYNCPIQKSNITLSPV